MKALALLLSSLLFLSVTTTDELPRRHLFGAQLVPNDNGVAVGQLSPNGPAAKAGLRSGDLIVSFGETTVHRPEELIAAVKATASNKTEVEIVRDGQKLKLPVELAEVPRETSDEYDVIYDSVRANGTLRRTIITKPHGNSKRPAVVFAGGLGCYSLDNVPASVSPYIALIQDLTRNGFVVMRVEKSGMGDSQGVPCAEQDFENELAGLRAGLAKLRTYPYVDSKRLFFIGHSIGALDAPILANETPLRGIVAMSTAGHQWLDYEAVNAERQMKMEGHSGDELQTRLATRRGCLDRLITKRETPEQIAKDKPACEEFLQYPAHYSYMQQVGALDLPALWKRVSVPVLLIHGASDFVTDAEEHQFIARQVNASHRGLASVVIEPRMDHFMNDVASPEESMRTMKADTIGDQSPQTQVRKDIIEWLKKKSGGKK